MKVAFLPLWVFYLSQMEVYIHVLSAFFCRSKETALYHLICSGSELSSVP